MPLYRKPRSPFFWYDVQVAGRRYRGSTKQKGVTLARQYEAALIHKLNSRTHSELRTKAPILSEFATRFLQFVKESRLDSDTKLYYQNGWRMLSKQTIARHRIDAVTTSSASTIKPGGSGANVNCALRTLRRMLSLAAEWNLIQQAPRIHMTKERRRERLMTPAEEIVILAKANPSIQDVLVLMMDTGVRPSEAVAIRWANVDFVRGTIFIEGGKTHNARRHVSMSGRVRDLLVRRAARGGEVVFPSSRRPGEHLLGRSVVAMFSQLKRELHLPEDLVLYSARHTFATDYQSIVGDLSKTSRQLGHGSLAITQRYLHPTCGNTTAEIDARNLDRHTLGHTSVPIQ